jgi:indolepyruvate ferredoxin oxidoreductase
LSVSAIEGAIRLNGVAVSGNLRAFQRGRQFAVDSPTVLRVAGLLAPDGADIEPSVDVDRLIQFRAAELVAYQDAAYASTYREAVESISRRERQVRPGSTSLTSAVARNLFKLMAYKDEYEVARLLLDSGPDLPGGLRTGTFRVWYWHLHPPALRALGLKRKLRLGRRFRPVLHMLHALRRLRGTALDPFARANVRAVERELVVQYLEVLHDITAALDDRNYAQAIEIAELPDMVRGFELVKLRTVDAYQEQLGELRGSFAAERTRLANR